MKFISLLFVLSVVAVMSMLLVAMSTDASAQSALADKPRAAVVIGAAADASRSALSAIAPTQLDTPSVAKDSQRKNVKKRSRAKCARITGNCWNGV